MTTSRFGALALACVLAFPSPARGADIVINSEAACASIGGEWSAYGDGGSCHVVRLVIPAGMRVVVSSGVAFHPDSLINDGVLETNGRFDPGPFTNRGTLITNGTTVNWGLLVNKGRWVNHGWLHPHNAVLNEWNFENDGFFET